MEDSESPELLREDLAGTIRESISDAFVRGLIGEIMANVTRYARGLHGSRPYLEGRFDCAYFQHVLLDHIDRLADVVRREAVTMGCPLKLWTRKKGAHPIVDNGFAHACRQCTRIFPLEVRDVIFTVLQDLRGREMGSESVKCSTITAAAPIRYDFVVSALSFAVLSIRYHTPRSHTLLRRAEVIAWIAEIESSCLRRMVLAVVEEADRLYAESPLSLKSSLDLVFLAEILVDMCDELDDILSGRQELLALYWGEWPKPYPRIDIEDDFYPDWYVVRTLQSRNYALGVEDPKLCACLRSITSRVAQANQEATASTGKVYKSFYAMQPTDCLFVSMVMHRALSPGHAARAALEEYGASRS